MNKELETVAQRVLEAIDDGRIQINTRLDGLGFPSDRLVADLRSALAQPQSIYMDAGLADPPAYDSLDRLDSAPPESYALPPDPSRPIERINLGAKGGLSVTGPRPESESRWDTAANERTVRPEQRPHPAVQSEPEKPPAVASRSTICAKCDHSLYEHHEPDEDDPTCYCCSESCICLNFAEALPPDSAPLCVATFYEGRDEPNLECALVPHYDGLHFDCKRGIQWRFTNEADAQPKHVASSSEAKDIPFTVPPAELPFVAAEQTKEYCDAWCEDRDDPDGIDDYACGNLLPCSVHARAGQSEPAKDSVSNADETNCGDTYGW